MQQACDRLNVKIAKKAKKTRRFFYFEKFLRLNKGIVINLIFLIDVFTVIYIYDNDNDFIFVDFINHAILTNF